MKARSSVRLAVAGFLVIAGCATMGGAPVKSSGGVLVNSAGMTLYTFDKDPAGAGKSVCVDKCASLWPAFLAAADAQPGGDYSIIRRDDGSRQWAYRGKPLYLFAKDQKPGDKSGDGFNKVWHVITQPAASAVPRPMGY